jgi:hypothetical protein
LSPPESGEVRKYSLPVTIITVPERPAGAPGEAGHPGVHTDVPERIPRGDGNDQESGGSSPEGRSFVKRIAFIVFALFLIASPALPQSVLNAKEPPRSSLMAPLYHGAVFIQVIPTSNPYYFRAEYATSDSMPTVLAFYIHRPPGIRMFNFYDRRTYMFGFVRQGSKLPDRPEWRDLRLLDDEQNVTLIKFDSFQSAPLVRELRRSPDTPENRAKIEALKTARIMIRYTYRVTEENPAAQHILGLWRVSDRDQKGYYGSTILFRNDSTYVLTLTPENLKELGQPPSSGTSERGRYSVLGNIIALRTDSPVMGAGRKDGHFSMKGATLLSLEIEGWPRLTYNRPRPEDRRGDVSPPRNPRSAPPINGQ